jgi:hypothetical protein
MALKKPIIFYNDTNSLEELRAGDTVSTSESGLGFITGSSVIDFGFENNSKTITISSSLINNLGLKGFNFMPIETSETSLDDFSLNGLMFNLVNIIDSSSFDIRATAINNASGNYTIQYKIMI